MLTRLQVILPDECTGGEWMRKEKQAEVRSWRGRRQASSEQWWRLLSMPRTELSPTYTHTIHLYLWNESSHVILYSWSLLVSVWTLVVKEEYTQLARDGYSSFPRDCIYDGPMAMPHMPRTTTCFSRQDTASLLLILNCLMCNSRGQTHWALIWEMAPYFNFTFQRHQECHKCSFLRYVCKADV